MRSSRSPSATSCRSCQGPRPEAGRVHRAGQGDPRPDPLLHPGSRRAVAGAGTGRPGRKTVRTSREKLTTITIDDERLAKYAGVKKYRYGETDEVDQVGIVTGLAWTEFGGDILTIEAVKMPGKGRMTSPATSRT
jgi:hypothetical protein